MSSVISKFWPNCRFLWSSNVYVFKTTQSAGETVITASAGNKSHSVVIIVSDGTKGEYAITVNGGSANLNKAREGDTVSLTANPAKTEKFVRWEFVNPDTNEVIEAGVGKFGPYVKEGKTYKSLEASDDVYESPTKPVISSTVISLPFSSKIGIEVFSK